MYILRSVALAASLASLVACSDNSATRSASSPSSKAAPDTAVARKVAKEFRVHYNRPVDLDSTDGYFLPVSVVPLDGAARSRTFSSGSYESDSDRNGIEGTCYNLVFLQKATLSEHLLLTHSRFVIADIDIEKKPDARWPYLFYTIMKADTNGDGEQDKEDVSALYVSDRSGQQLHQLTPDGTDLVSWQILPKTNVLLAEVRPDVNKDREFTHADGTYWLRFDLQNLRVAPAQQPTAPLSKQLQQQMLERQSRLPQ
ncbi:hypothetical protein [Hymenobacter wooponensis]|uniref:Lipoprotein n=1 Tax=Hymenobacter wooponensis TaxID=1525360 RepID=A0A4Z0MT18_9BACT|nr:hypothetical protein [Hymenobacter wooponensis]TGD82764.1 hypothetical protein EU557_02990 [Hymenobacter wooponensis]